MSSYGNIRPRFDSRSTQRCKAFATATPAMQVSLRLSPGRHPMNDSATDMLATARDSNRVRTWVPLSMFALYIIWGSTYLGIRVALESYPPFLLGGIRFAIAGLAAV